MHDEALVSRRGGSRGTDWRWRASSVQLSLLGGNGKRPVTTSMSVRPSDHESELTVYGRPWIRSGCDAGRWRDCRCPCCQHTHLCQEGCAPQLAAARASYRHVVARADKRLEAQECAGVRLGAARHGVGDDVAHAKVAELHFAFGVEQDVGRLHICSCACSSAWTCPTIVRPGPNASSASAACPTAVDDLVRIVQVVVALQELGARETSRGPCMQT